MTLTKKLIIKILFIVKIKKLTINLQPY